MRLGKEDCIRYLLAAVAGSSLLALAGIVLFLFLEGLPLFSTHSPLDFLGGMLWYPTEDPGLFGIFPLLVASLAVTALSSLLAVPLGVMTAVYLNELAPPAARRIIKPFVELLAALAYFHRKRPTKKTPVYTELAEDMRAEVRPLSLFLLLAERMDKSHRQIIRTARFLQQEDRLLLRVSAADDCPIEMEQLRHSLKNIRKVFGSKDIELECQREA